MISGLIFSLIWRSRFSDFENIGALTDVTDSFAQSAFLILAEDEVLPEGFARKMALSWVLHTLEVLAKDTLSGRPASRSFGEAGWKSEICTASN
jgi:hypothetical protein